MDVAAQVLPAGMVIDSMQAALEHGKDTLDAIGGHVPAHVLFGAVVVVALVLIGPIGWLMIGFIPFIAQGWAEGRSESSQPPPEK